MEETEENIELIRENQEEIEDNLRRNCRFRNVPKKFGDYKMEVDNLAMSIETFIDDVPSSLEGVKSRPDYKYWKQAVKEEMIALEENNA